MRKSKFTESQIVTTLKQVTEGPDRKKIVDPAHKRPLLAWLQDRHGWSERRACTAVGMSRSTARYRHRPDRDEEVIALLAELAERFPERGFGKLFQLIRHRGLVWNHKRVWRVYCLMRLNQRQRGKRRLAWH